MRCAFLLVALLTLAVVPAASAKGATLSVSVKEIGCPDGASLCFTLESGSLADVTAGAPVTVMFRNDGSGDHEILATRADKMDPKHEATTEEGHLGSVEDVSPGGFGNMSLTAPTDANGVYFWCGKEGHEVDGMWMLASYAATQTKRAPGPGFVGLIGLLVVITLVARRR